MKKMLFLNACVNREVSRTLRIGKELIALLQKNGDYEVTELVLEEENFPSMLSAKLNERNALLKKKAYSNPMFDLANQFKDADCIVVAAPYWDFSYPSILKTYIEVISVPGIVYRFGENGRPVGQCKAENLYYVTTRGGNIGDERDLGFGTMAQLGKFYGIKDVKCIGVDGFDIPTNDVEALVAGAVAELSSKI